MKLEKLSALAELLSAIAIVVTLAYLAIQTRQNAVAIQATVRQSMLDDDRELLFRAMEYASTLTAERRGDALSDEQLYEVNAFLTASMRIKENQWLQYQNEVIDEQTWLTYREPIKVILHASETRRDWWRNASASGQFDAEFVRIVNTLLEDTPIGRADSVAESLGFE